MCSRRFWTAPNEPRSVETASIAASIAEIASVWSTSMVPTLSDSVAVSTAMTSPSLAPIWNVIVPF